MSERYDPVTGELGNGMQGEGNGGTPPAVPEPVITEVPGTSVPEPAMHFDPMTGETVMGSGNMPGINFVEPPKKPEKNRNKLWIGLAIAAAALVVVVSAAAAAAVKSGVFMSNSGKVLLALTNTMSYHSHLAEDLAPFLILAEDEYTLGLEIEMPEENTTVELQYCSLPSQKQLTGGVDVSYFPTIHFIAEVTPEKVKLHIPFLDKRIFTYNYTEEKTGYLTEMFSAYELEALDTFFETLFLEPGEESLREILSSPILEWYHSFELEKVEAEEFEVNGKERKCDGYQFTIVSEDMVNLTEQMEEICFGNYPEGIYNPYEYYFDELWYMFSDMQDLDVTFYLYKNRIECLRVEGNEEKLDILFESDTKGNLDMEFIFMDETVMEIERNITDSVEECIIREYDYEDYYLGMTYNFQSGDYAIDMEDYYDEYSLTGNVQSDSKSVTVTMETTDDYGDELNFKLSVEKGATIEALEGTEVDLGNMSEDDWYDLLDDFWWW